LHELSLWLVDIGKAFGAPWQLSLTMLGLILTQGEGFWT
jgi:hypothetical protein